jgi:membrane-associated phospholipid phosphatase
VSGPRPRASGRAGALRDPVAGRRPRVGGRGPAWAPRTAALCILAMAVVWTLAELVPAIRLRDAILLNDFTTLDRPGVDELANGLLFLLEPLLYTVWALSIVAVAVRRGRPRLALATAIVLPAAPGVAEALKPLLAHPHDSVGWQWIDPASWPSGHATAATTLVLCALLVAPRRLRPRLAAVGAVFVAAVGCALLILAWHLPSDVLGGFLLGALCVSTAVAALGAGWDEGPPATRARAPCGARTGSTAASAPASPHAPPAPKAPRTPSR